MYIQQDLSKHNRIYFPLVRDFLSAAPSSLPLIAEVNNRILSGDLYKALKAARKLISYEQELMSHATGGKSIRAGGAGHAVAQGA
jgi:flagellar protein FlbT